MAICRPAKLTKFLQNHSFCLLARQRGKFQAIADVADSHDQEARSFIYTEVEKKKRNLSRVCWVKRNEEQARSQPCVKGLPRKGGHLAYLVALVANFTDWSCRKLLIFLGLRKDLLIGIMIAVVESLPPDSSRRYCAPKFWTFAGVKMDAWVFCSRCCSTFFFVFCKFSENVSRKKQHFSLI